MIKLRGAYEAVSGLQGGYNHEDYTEVRAEATINFRVSSFRSSPTTSGGKYAPLRNSAYSTIIRYVRSFHASSPLPVGATNGGCNAREHSTALTCWTSTICAFHFAGVRDKYLNNEQNYILKYNYDDRLIVRTGYSYTYNSAGQALMNNAIIGNSYSIRFNFESAGNLLYAFKNDKHEEE